MTFPADATYSVLYTPAMEITDQKQADEYFQRLVQWHCERWGKLPAEAEEMVKSNLGYYAGYYDRETRERVERLFHCEHPILGPANKKLSSAEIFAMGVAAGQASRRKKK